MKYMGNKSKMLPLLGEVLAHYGRDSQQIADPFCGSAAVSWYLAENTDKAIIAGDLQSFAARRAAAVVERTETFDPGPMLKTWFRRASSLVDAVAAHFPNHLRSIEPDLTDAAAIKKVVGQSRRFCAEVLPVVFSEFVGPWQISKCYGGYYFSPTQALIFDSLRKTLPTDSSKRKVALAALTEACSKSAASPGHTAQPFQPTPSSAKYIIEAWTRDPWDLVEVAVRDIAARSATTVGKSSVADFAKTLEQLEPGDLVFADPPYSGVHYSRFYHVLEMVSRGSEFVPEGKGRYPEIQQRPSSAFSKKSEAKLAAKQLLQKCAEKKVNLVLTFPTGDASNGLSAKHFTAMGAGLFSRIETQEVVTDFSTLGGNTKNRAARQLTGESILTFVI